MGWNIAWKNTHADCCVYRGVKMLILDAAERLKIKVPDDVRNHLTNLYPHWESIWRGDVPWCFVYAKDVEKPRKRKLLNAAQTLTSYLSKLNMVEFSVSADVKCMDDYLQKILSETNFKARLREIDELKEAVGGVVIKPFFVGNEIKIDFISGQDFLPLAWNDSGITDALFISRYISGKKYYTQIERQQITDNQLKINQYLFKSYDNFDLGIEADFSDLPEIENVVEEVVYPLEIPLFVYVKCAYLNRYDPCSPLGVSRFDGAMDVLEAVDIAFDEMQIERLMAEKMIFVSQMMVDSTMDIDGVPKVKYNKDTRAYQILSAETKEGQLPETFDPNFRIEEHKLDLQTQLDLLCFKSGVDIGSMSFDGQTSVKTATEIRSSNSKTYQTVVDNQNIWATQLERLCWLIIRMAQLSGNLPDYPIGEIKVNFDDSVTPDRDSYIKEGLLLVNTNVISRYTFLTEYLGYTAERAKEELALIADEFSPLDEDEL